MTSFERWKERNSKRMEAQDRLNNNFIFKSNNSVILRSAKKPCKEILAAVVNKQEKDQAYIYTHLADKLSMGSVWGAKTLNWLIAEEIITMKDVTWHKYLSYLCNINIEGTWGYFKGPEKTYVNIKDESGASLESLQKPVLVLPENVLGFKDKIVIKNRPWLVQEWDAISSPGLVYYSLRATTISKEVAAAHEGEDVYIEHYQGEITPIPTEPEQKTGSEELEYRIANQMDIDVSTEDGYFKADKKVQVKKHTATEIIFTIPFGISEVNIQTKEGGEIVTEKFVTNK